MKELTNKEKEHIRGLIEEIDICLLELANPLHNYCNDTTKVMGFEENKINENF